MVLSFWHTLYMASQTIHFRERGIDNSQATLKGIRRRLAVLKDTSMEPIVLEPTQSVFDLDSKSDVTLYKQVTFTPVDNTKEALERVGNDSAAFLKIINDGLRSYTNEAAKKDESIPWQAKDEDGNLIPFTGTTISEEKSVQLQANVLNMAKMVFGYQKTMSADEKENRILKAAAKDKARDMLLGNPAVVASLKS
jgi:hypothetical protein